MSLGSRCQALDGNGRQCRCTSVLLAVQYHGNGELYGYDGPEPQWVRVLLCERHRGYLSKPMRRGGRKPRSEG